MPGDSAQRYKDFAAECLRLAQQAADADQKARLVEMAQDWQRLAEAAAKRENQ